MSEKKNFPQIEEEIQKFWKDNKVFEKSVSQRDEKDSYVFYDGPPFATGLPHYGHIVAGTMKDLVPRYWAMKGKRVERRWGWDCHGLPVENIVEKELKLNSRKDIEDLGVDKFNEICRTKVLTYADEWKKIISRLGRWVDMENDYKTMDVDYMESVWWVFKSLWEKDFLYEGHKSMHICPRCETTLSNIEVTQNYKDLKDLSVISMFELVEEEGTYVLAWTTTPWTLPGNVALAVGEDLDYVKVSFEDKKYILVQDLVAQVFEGKEHEVVERFTGKALEGKKYKPLFDNFIDQDLVNKENLFVIVTADFVSVEDGTGVVHLAPAFGEDDMLIGKEKDLSFIQHVGFDGRFVEAMGDLAGKEVKPKEDPTATDVDIIKYLAVKGLLFAKKKYEHSYPFCWRCESPLLNYATSSWFVKVSDIKPEALEYAKEVNWVPGHLKEGRYGQWLEGARDWSISRSRYWGTPLPVWKCECGEIKVIGSREELEKLSGEKTEDLHKHFVDKMEIPCEKCDGTMKRISEVLDCWFESGSMPYGQMHYPFENKEKFEANFPAEFIAEGVDQCRAWFYVLHVLGSALFNKNSYKNVVVNGIVLAEDGQKMSKSKQNYPDPMILVEKYGADALRYYLANSSVMRAEDLRFAENGVDEVYKKVILITLNILSFYKMYEDKIEKEVKSEYILDRWILAKANETVKEVNEQMEAYELMRAIKPIGEFINELSTWYVRRSRDRFKNDETANAAGSTLKEVLSKLALVMAPFTPFMAEHIWMNLGNKESVHLQDWPEADEKAIDEKLLADMLRARQIVEMGLAARDEAKVKVRQPLQYLRYEAKELGEELEQIVAEELNVKEVKWTEQIQHKPDRMLKEDGELRVALNLEMTEELKLEGLLRETTRGINNLRKKQGLTINDKVSLTYKTDGAELKKLFANVDLVEKLKQATLVSDLQEGEGKNQVKVNDEELIITLTK
jgi:isoleucyl-tRNA synthetase